MSAESSARHCAQRPRDAPGPPPRMFAGHLKEFRRAPLDFLLRATREYGDVLRLRMGPRRVHFLRHPEHIQHVLQRNQDNYRKQLSLRFLFGNGVATTNGDRWKRQRLLLQPSFRHPEVNGPAVRIVLAHWAKRWDEVAAAARPIDMADEMMHLTLELVTATLFGGDLSSVIEAIRGTVSVIRSQVTARLLSILPLPLWLPTHDNRVLRTAIRAMDATVYRVIARRRRMGGGGDVLAALLAARDEIGRPMSDRQLRDEILTLLVAGHENTGNALAWMWYLMARHPAVEQRLHAELDSILNARPPTWMELPALPYTRMVVAESLRLYPPGWIVRIATRADTVGGYRIPARSMVLISPYLTHRHPDFWPEPEVFRPERFAAGMEHLPHRFAYLPFGGGGRRCLGMAMAETECQLILATLAQRFRIDLDPSHPVELQTIPTLAPLYGLKVRLWARVDHP
jgi:cytochrome P450